MKTESFLCDEAFCEHVRKQKPCDTPPNPTTPSPPPPISKNMNGPYFFRAIYFLRTEKKFLKITKIETHPFLWNIALISYCPSFPYYKENA